MQFIAYNNFTEIEYLSERKRFVNSLVAISMVNYDLTIKKFVVSDFYMIELTIKRVKNRLSGRCARFLTSSTNLYGGIRSQKR